MRFITVFLFGLLLFSCRSKSEHHLKEWAVNYFKTYSLRTDSVKFYSFYANKFSYRNVNFDNVTSSPKELVNLYYDWYNPDFKYSGAECLRIESLMFNDSTIVASGYFLPYTYKEFAVDSTKFMIELKLDKNRKIVEQTDWINYDLQTIIDAYRFKTGIEME